MSLDVFHYGFILGHIQGVGNQNSKVTHGDTRFSHRKGVKRAPSAPSVTDPMTPFTVYHPNEKSL